MKTLKAAIAHGGGPTAVLNASLAGVVDAARDRFGALYGARFGLPGLLEPDMPDLLAISPARIAAAGASPGSSLGSSRRAFSEEDYARLIGTLRQRDIRVLFHTGGNGSMGTALAISRHARALHFDLQVIGVPKTLDNDLLVTHHAPGYASSAYYFACAARDAGVDNRSLPSPVLILETLGRNVGWIAAATSLARRAPDDAPHLIYFPERPRSLDHIAADVERVYRRLGRAVVIVCEGQLDETGKPFGADVDRPDSPVHRLATNLGHTLAKLLSARLGLRVRAERPGLLGRSCGPFARERDRHDAYACGRAAVEAAEGGNTEAMVALGPDSNTFLTPLEAVAGHERSLPVEWISPEGNDVTGEFGRYARPLTGEVPGYEPMF